MTRQNSIVSGVVLLAILVVVYALLLLRIRPTTAEIELAKSQVSVDNISSDIVAPELFAKLRTRSQNGQLPVVVDDESTKDSGSNLFSQ